MILSSQELDCRKYKSIGNNFITGSIGVRERELLLSAGEGLILKRLHFKISENCVTLCDILILTSDIRILDL